MTIGRTKQYAALALAGALAGYIVAFHGFSAVVKGVMEQTRIQTEVRSSHGRAVRLIVPLL